MKSAFALILCLFSTAALANPVQDVLSKYETRDINNSCAVSFVNQLLKIEGSEHRASLQIKVENIELVDGGLLASYVNYNGTGEFYFLKKTNSLVVLGTWVDRDNGVDKSSFCELALK